MSYSDSFWGKLGSLLRATASTCGVTICLQSKESMYNSPIIYKFLPAVVRMNPVAKHRDFPIFQPKLAEAVKSIGNPNMVIMVSAKIKFINR